jgi:hypothetical protein
LAQERVSLHLDVPHRPAVDAQALPRKLELDQRYSCLSGKDVRGNSGELLECLRRRSAALFVCCLFGAKRACRVAPSFSRIGP